MAEDADRTGQLPFVSMVLPCRNEEQFIGLCLDSLVANDYPKDHLEILVVDGMSDDHTREIVGRYERKYPFVRILDNPRQIIPAAMNIGIRAAVGEIIMKIDAHAAYEDTYVSKCIRYLREYNAENVGGRVVARPRLDTVVGWAIAYALSHPFGVGGSLFRTSPAHAVPRWADTAFSGCYRKDVFGRVGLYDENIARTEDLTLNARIRRAGGGILFVPEIVSYYYSRSDLLSFWRHNFDNGIWAILPMRYTGVPPVSPRHLAPMAWVTLLIALGALSFFSPAARQVWLWSAGGYALVSLLVSAAIAVRERDVRYALVMPVVFAALHLSYGLGSLVGLAKVVAGRLSPTRC
jgi:cellulose synthase/poly-beta-1,6-N-acetylglucosamine synthase-like glycosyltransferase